MVGISRELTVVRIPLKSAKHHFGATTSRGQRPYNEDAYQAGTIEIPAFAKRRPMSLTRQQTNMGTSADSASGDPQVFYYGVFDGHGGSECSEFLRDRLHTYVEESAQMFELQSSLKRREGEITAFGQSRGGTGTAAARDTSEAAAERQSTDGSTDRSMDKSTEETSIEPLGPLEPSTNGPKSESGIERKRKRAERTEQLQRDLLRAWRDLVGGYYRRFKPEFFSSNSGGKGRVLVEDAKSTSDPPDSPKCSAIETVLEYAFLRADYEFVSAQASKAEDSVKDDRAINADDILGDPARKQVIGGPKRFKGGSTCSVALISTPTAMPYWHPSSPATLVTSHVGDTRILLCETSTGLAVPTTTDHHPSHPREADRMRRYAATFVTDSFGEERVLGLANTRAFGDMASKRIGVSAEPDITLVEMSPAQYSFIVLVSDGVSGTLSDQEIVDIVKEAKTPEDGARAVVAFATEVTTEGDNATALVVRLGGWERRSEGGVGSLGTKEMRDWRREEALDPRTRRR
ncbi:protein phosphatase 2c [Trichodelitschia bisporula]|uniref:Protein phosphatase 2c n=1 Tax=Trichodelitschia bisporula TaxID=703511 RepID=A0A6G1HK52_9PEZI|nr:protein phosphatase 2c [Trichodelitschia bisporula]